MCTYMHIYTFETTVLFKWVNCMAYALCIIGAIWPIYITRGGNNLNIESLKMNVVREGKKPSIL